MELFTTITLGFCGVYFIIFGKLQIAKNIVSSIIYKIIPVLSGLACIISFIFRVSLFNII